MKLYFIILIIFLTACEDVKIADDYFNYHKHYDKENNVLCYYRYEAISCVKVDKK